MIVAEEEPFVPAQRTAVYVYALPPIDFWGGWIPVTEALSDRDDHQHRRDLDPTS